MVLGGSTALLNHIFVSRNCKTIKAVETIKKLCSTRNSKLLLLRIYTITSVYTKSINNIYLYI